MSFPLSLAARRGNRLIKGARVRARPTHGATCPQSSPGWVQKAALPEWVYVRKVEKRRTKPAIHTRIKRTVFTKKKQKKIRQLRKRPSPNCPEQGGGQSLALRGLNVQWPFSQLLLSGAKTLEIRRYGLGYLNIARAHEEMWLVETLGKSSKPATVADISHGTIFGPRPTRAQIVGCITFSACHQIISKEQFSSSRASHCIRAGSIFDWQDDASYYAWNVSATRQIIVPVPAPENKSITGFKRRSFNVTFDPPVDQQVR